MAVMVSPGAGRVLIALSDGPLVAEPTWTRHDNITACRNYGFDCYAGRQSELDTTDTGTASVYFHDQNSTLDDADLVGLQIMLQLYNPVLAEWEIRWRGHIDEIQRGLVDVSGYPLADTAIQCVGIFDYLGGVRMLPGVFGDFASALSDDTVFYENEGVNERITALLENAGLETDMFVVFSGNVNVNETQYDPDDVILQAVRDAVDAEWPSGGAANFYENRGGQAVFHGRFARFSPEATAATVPGAWDFTRWDAATREDVTGSVAQVREFSYNIPRSRIINSYLAWPKEDDAGLPFDRDLIPTLLKTDPTSITAYGYRGQTAGDLIIKDHKTLGTGADECERFGTWYVTHYSQPRKAVQSISLSSLPPGDARAAATWDLMCRCDISDVIELTIDEAELADEEFFVDGIRIECRPANPSFDHVVVTPNLTPGAYYGDPEP